MMPPSTIVQPPTPVSTVSSLITNNAANATTSVQSGPYTKAQFQNTMEGSRSVKNVKEIEQLLRDYPAALELYRTGRYKVKVKNEADIERVILVEKRTNKTTSNNVTQSNEFQQNKQTVPDVTNTADKNKERSRSRTHSRDRVAPTTSVPDNNNSALVQTTTSSIRMTSNAQPKVDHHRTPSKEREASITSQSKQQQQQQETDRRSHSRDSRSKTSHSKHRGKKNSRDYQNAIVPYVPNVNPAGNMWQHARALQPYYSNPILTHQQPMSNMYMPSPFVSQPYPGFQQPYYYAQPPYAPPLVYQKPAPYATSSTVKSAGTATNKTLPATYNYPPPSQPTYNPNQGANLPPSFHTFHPSQQQYSHPQAMYYSQLPFQTHVVWPTTANRPADPVVNNNNNAQVDSRGGSKQRARSVDTGPRNHPSVRFYNQQQQQQPPAPAVIEQQHHHHHHRHHHYRSQPTNVQVITTGPSVEAGKDQNATLKETTAAAAAAAANNGANGEKLTIRQLNEIFVRTDPSGRLPYSSLPNILQRFGIALTENDLTSAAKSLDYNTNEPLSARRLVHVLVNLGKIAKSTQQQRSAASPVVLPEDREVNDIMTQRRVAGAVSTHIHSSAYPNQWY